MSSWQKFKESFISKESSSQNSNQSSSSWQKYKSIAIKKREDDDREKMLQNKIREAERDQQERQAKRDEQDVIVRKIQEEREQKLKEQEESKAQEIAQKKQQYAEQLAEIQKNISTSPTEQAKNKLSPTDKIKLYHSTLSEEDKKIKSSDSLGNLKKVGKVVKASKDIESEDLSKKIPALIRYGIDRGKQGIKNVPGDIWDSIVVNTASDHRKYTGEGSFGDKLAKLIYNDEDYEKYVKENNARLDEIDKHVEEYAKEKNADNNAEQLYQQTLTPEARTIGSTGEQVGRMLPIVGLSAINPYLGDMAMMTSSSGQESVQLLDEGVELPKARTVGNLKGLAEVSFDKLIGGVKFRGGTLDDIVGNVIANKTKTKVSNFLLTKGYQIGGEIVEENLTNLAGYGIDKLILDKDTNLGEMWADAKETSKTTFLTTLTLNLMGLGGSNYSTNTTVNQQLINEYENITNTKLNKQQKENLLGKVDQIKQEIENNSEVQEQGMTQEQNMIPMETATNEGSYTKQQELLNNIENNQETKVELDKMLNNKDLPMQGYKYEASDNLKINQLRQEASQYFNNSEEAHKFVEMLEKIIADKDIEIRLDANLKTADGRVANGSYSDGVITINPNSARTGEFIAIHELTHAIGTKSMMNIVDNYRKSNAEFNSAVENLLKDYNSTQLTEEALSDVSAQLFGNQEFINNIANTNPGFFKKIYNEIKYLWHQFRGYKKQNQFIEDLYYKWTKAYNSNKQLNGETNYSIAGRKAIENIRKDYSQEYDEAMKAYDIARKMARKGISNEIIRKETNWFQDKKGKWKFEFSDKDMEIKPYVFKKNTEYNLEQVLKHDTLFKYYPELRKYSVIFQDLKGINASYSRSKKIIRLDERKFNSRIDEAGTLIHEIQHAIQGIEGFSSGTSSKKGVIQYYKNIGEIEASDVKNRMLQEKNGITLKEAPESSKKHPIHPDLKELNVFDKARFYIYNSIVDMSKKGGKNDGEVHSINQNENKKDSRQDRNMVVGRERLNNIEEIENSNKSSFSIDNQESWQQHLDKNFKATGTRTNMKDIGINVAPTAKNNVAPNMGNYEVQRKQKKTMNPTEISNLKLDDANTTPELKERRYESGNKQSSFFSNIVTDAKFLSEELRQEMAKEDNIRYYKGITNKETLEKAYTKLQKDGQEEVINWHSKDSKNANAEDVTEGWILLKQYQDKGDYENAVKVAKKMRDIGTTAGQTIQAYNILSRLTPEGMFYYAQSELSEAYNKMVEGKSKKWIEENKSKFDLTPEETANIMDIMQDVSTMEDGYAKKVKIAEVQKIITDKIPPTAGQSIKSWMRISMLFNTKTQVRNVMGNAVIMPVNAGSDIFASALDKLIAKKTGVRTTGTTKLKKYGKGFLKGLYESYNDFRKGINTRNIEGNRFEVSEGKNFKNKGIGKALNGLDSMLSFALDAGDRGFYEATFVNSINNQLVLNNTTEVTQEMIDIATTEALQRTWQDNNAYTQAVLTIRNILNGKVGKYKGMSYGLGDVLIPFAKTPANLTKAIVDYSPAGLVKTLVTDARKFKNSLDNGQYSPQLQHRFVQNLGKGMAGSILYAISYALAKAGIATGESDEDKDVKNFMKNSLGISSYSIKIGNKSFTYDWAQPIAAPLSIMTNIVNSEDKGTALLEGIVGNLDTAGGILLEQSFMQSLNEAINDNDGIVSGLINQTLELPARAVPTFSKHIADLVDGTQRTTFEYGRPLKSSSNSIIAKIPFASKTLPASIDTLGNEIQKYGGENNIFNVMINPANTNKGKLSKAGEEIYNVYNQTGDITIFPRTAPYYINSKGEKVVMDAHQRSEFQTISGKYVENSMNKLLNDSDYKKLDDEAKAEIINEIVSDSYSKAKYDVLKIDSKEYAKLRETFKNVSSVSYYNYKFKTKDMKKDSDKIDVLINADYTNKEKTALYEQYIVASNDKKYPIIKEIFTENGLNITKYLKYKNQEFKADRKDDGTLEGKSISGSKKEKVWNYIENMDITYTQKLILYGLEYTPTDREQKQIVNYINSLPNKTSKEKLEILNQFQGFTIYKNGTFKY